MNNKSTQTQPTNNKSTQTMTTLNAEAKPFFPSGLNAEAKPFYPSGLNAETKPFYPKGITWDILLAPPKRVVNYKVPRAPSPSLCSTAYASRSQSQSRSQSAPLTPRPTTDQVFTFEEQDWEKVNLDFYFLNK